MPFGAPQQAAPAASGGIRWDLRTISVAEGQEKKTTAGKVYWRIKDTNGFWYSCWDATIKANLEIAAENNDSIPVAVKISPGKDGGKPFYNIEGTGESAAQIVEDGKATAAVSAAPGGRNSEFGKRMHPDESLRIGLMNSSTKAVDMAIATLEDRPKEVTREQWIYAKIPEYMNFINSLINMPLTPTPDAEPEVAATGSFQPATS